MAITVTESDIGRMVVYTGNRSFGGKDEYGYITSYNKSFVFVRYKGRTSEATLRSDLEYKSAKSGEKTPLNMLRRDAIILALTSVLLDENDFGHGGEDHVYVFTDLVLDVRELAEAIEKVLDDKSKTLFVES